MLVVEWVDNQIKEKTNVTYQLLQLFQEVELKLSSGEDFLPMVGDDLNRVLRRTQRGFFKDSYGGENEQQFE